MAQLMITKDQMKKYSQGISPIPKNDIVQLKNLHEIYRASINDFGYSEQIKKFSYLKDLELEE